MNKIVRQLRREMRTNPKKAVVLGLLGVVAVWFWAPLAASWIAPDDPAAEHAAVASPVALSLPEMSPQMPITGQTASDPTPETGESPGHSWQQLARWIDADPRTLATKVSCDQRDPFVVPRAEVVEESLDDESGMLPGPSPEELTPESLGMVLSSTIIGPRDRGARINGKLYQQGESIVLELEGQPIEFSLAEVHLRHVVLGRNEERFELKIPAPSGAGRIEVFQSRN